MHTDAHPQVYTIVNVPYNASLGTELRIQAPMIPGWTNSSSGSVLHYLELVRSSRLQRGEQGNGGRWEGILGQRKMRMRHDWGREWGATAGVQLHQIQGPVSGLAACHKFSSFIISLCCRCSWIFQELNKPHGSNAASN